MADIVRFPGITTLDLNPQQVFDMAADAKLTSVVILGHTQDGEEYFASSLADGGDVLWLIERLKLALLTFDKE